MTYYEIIKRNLYVKDKSAHWRKSTERHQGDVTL